MTEPPTFAFRVIVVSLAAICVAVVFVMLYGLFDEKVNNDKIFSIIGPAFQTVVGAFVGILSSRRSR